MRSNFACCALASAAPTARRPRAAAPRRPPSHDDLVLGHEMFGQVADVGRAVTMVTPGDYAVFTVRRGCGRCRSCAMNRSDMCQTGLYSERGIWALDGYQTEYVVDQRTVHCTGGARIGSGGRARRAVFSRRESHLGSRPPATYASAGFGHVARLAFWEAVSGRWTGADRFVGGTIAAPARRRGLGS